MQIPIINGIYTDNNADFRTSYPRNMIPVPKPQGISNGYLRPADGIREIGTGPGASRGAINWENIVYRVMGSRLVREAIDGTITDLGSVGTDNKQVSLDYSFDYLGVVSNTNFFLYDNSTVQQVTDPDLGSVIDFIWVDGYFMLTDGENLIVTELNDPFSVNPIRYGSSEIDPDPVLALIKLRNEPHALNRYTIEVFDNIGGTGFPFQRIDGAQISRGTVGTHACCLFYESIAFVGGGRNEAVSIWLGAGGSTTKIATREIDQILTEYTDAQLADILVEARFDKNHRHLYVRLPDKTLVYDQVASGVVGQAVWFSLSSDLDSTQDTPYLGKDLVWCYNEWRIAHSTSNQVGVYDDSIASHWGQIVGWSFNTIITYNEGRGVIFHELELVALPGRAALGDDSKLWTQYSKDGINYSVPKSINAGRQGQNNKRLVWIQQGAFRNWRLQRFFGTSVSMLSFARLQARTEALAV